jgi:hypothetical protein
MNPAAKAAIEAARVPVDEWSPAQPWIACIDQRSAKPTPAELALLRSLIEFLSELEFMPLKATRILGQALPLQPSGDTIPTEVFTKAPDGWRYRRSHWEGFWFPSLVDEGKPLLALIEANVLSAHAKASWPAWRKAHAAIFRPAAKS